MHPEVARPPLRPELDATLDRTREVVLFIAEPVRDPLWICLKLLKDVTMLSNRKAEYRGLAQTGPGSQPIPCEDHIIGIAISKIRVDRSGDHGIQIDEKRNPLDPLQILVPKRGLTPLPLGIHRHITSQFRKGQAFHLRPDSLRIIRKTEYTKRRRHISGHHPIDPVDMIGPIFRSPLDTKHLLFC